MPLNSTKIKRIIIVRNDRFGEFLLNVPALRAVRETFPLARITLVVDQKIQELVPALRLVDDSLAWKMSGNTLKDKFRMFLALKRMRPDMAIMLNPSKDFNILTFLAGIPVRVGYERKCGFLLTHKVEDLKHLAKRHEVEYNLELVRLVGAETGNRSLFLEVNNGIIQSSEVKSFVDSCGLAVALHPWTSDPLKQWPVAYFQDLAKRLSNELGLQVVIIGGAESAVLGREYFNLLGSKALNLTGKTTLLELAAILKKCRLLVSGDSGPVHLACSVATPVIALFRNDLPGKNPKRWGPWLEGSRVIEKPSLNDITVSEVVVKIQEVLKR